MRTRICPICGKEFEPKSSAQKYCNRTITVKCVNCGKEFQTTCNKEMKKCCSTTCRAQYNEKQGHTKYKICVKCGESFLPKSSRQRYCHKPVLSHCVICGKEFYSECDADENQNHTCDNPECRHKYAHLKSVEAVQQQTKKCKWCGRPFHPVAPNQIYCGSVHYQTCKYCGKQFVVHPEISLADTPVFCSQECSQKYHTGINCVLTRKDIQEKIKQTNLEKYGAIYHNLTDPSKIAELDAFKSDPQHYIDANFKDKPTLTQIADSVGVQPTTIGIYIHKYKLESKVLYSGNKHTRPEEAVVNELQKLDPSIEIIQNTRKIITPYELDIWIPKYNFAIEVDPTVTHNHTIDSFTGGAGLPIKYHQQKTEMCEAKGIFLYHVFGYDWHWHKDQVVSMIKNVLCVNHRKIYARNCQIVVVSSKDCAAFLNENHRQGNTYSNIRYGLVYNDELVSVMTFGKTRHTIGPQDNDYELVRFASLKDTNVLGGASKLFKQFIRDYEPQSIISFSDRAHTRGNLYKILGFEPITYSEPNYVWVDLQTDKAYHRINAQKQNIKKFLKDDSIDLTQSEIQIMKQHGFVQVFDSGTITWKWTNKENANDR